MNKAILVLKNSLVVFLVGLMIVTPLASIQAQEADKPETVPVEEEIPEVPAEETTPEPEPVPDPELPVEEPAQEEAPLAEEPEPEQLLPTNEQGAGMQFKIPTQHPATVDQSTGSLIYEYPIELPEGRNGLTPELALRYNSRNASKPDTFSGLGWELNIPYIQRERAKGTESIYSKAYFSSSLSGSLVATTDTASSQYTVYRSETDDGAYLKYTFNSSNSWTVTGKDGRTYTFGAAASSRQDNPANANQIYKWLVSKISDPQGNEIQYSYIKDNGQIYPSQIVYTYHPSAPAIHTVNFNYTTPGDYGSTVYNSGFAVTTGKLLNNIVVQTTVGTDTTADTYNLSYDNAQFLKQKLLAGVERVTNFAATEFNQQFTNVTTLTYSSKTPGWEQGTHALGDNLPYIDDTIYKDIYIADFDANGYPDVLVSTLPNGTQHNYFLLNNGTNFVNSTTAWSVPTNVNLSEHFAIVDVNGDHLPDLHPRGYGSDEPHVLYLNTGSGFTADASETWELGSYIPEALPCGPNVGDSNSFDVNAFFHDMNHDGKNDIVYFGGSADFRVLLNTGNGFAPSSAYTFTTAPGANFTIPNICTNDLDRDGYQTLMDINSDGLVDYYHQQYGTYLNTGSGFAYSESYAISIQEMDRSGFADINGDGLLDYIGFMWHGVHDRCAKVMFNNGSGFSQINPTSFPPCVNSGVWDPIELKFINNNPQRFGTLLDLTADGLPDIVGESTAGSAWGKPRAINDGKSAWVSNDNNGVNGWYPLIRPEWAKFFDINVDGVLDFITPNITWDGTTMADSKVYMGKSAVPNRLIGIISPLAAQTVVEYGTAPTNLDDTNVAPMPVVKKLSVQNISHGQPDMVTQYSYTKGAYVIDQATGQKRFTGFHKVTATESGSDLAALRITENYFHQANGSDSATNEPIDTSLALAGKPYYTVTKNPGSTLKKETWRKYLTHILTTEPGTNRVAKAVFATEMVNKQTEPGAATGTAEVYTYDTALGERTQLRQLGFVTVSSNGSYTDISGDTRYELTEYAANSNQTIVKPKRLEVTATLGSPLARTDLFYDNQAWGSIGAVGNLTKESKWISGNGAVVANTIYTYDAFGNVLILTNPRNAVTTYTYDTTKSQVATETNHLNHVTSYEYITGKLTKVTDPNGRVTTHGYSNRGWLFRTTVQNTGGNQVKHQHLDGTGGQWAIESYVQLVNNTEDQSWQSLDNLGRPVRLVRTRTDHSTGNPNGYYLKEANTYDALGREVTTSAPLGNSGSSYGSMYSVSVPSNLVTTTSYDVFDRPLSQTNALGTTTMSYAGPETTTTDANGHQKKIKVNAYGNVVQVKEYNGSQIYTTTYTYDARNLLTGITDALNNVRAFGYNNAGWLTSSEDLHAPTDTSFGITTFGYDVNGNQTLETKPNSAFVSRTFDLLDRPTVINGSTTMPTDFTLSYDACTNGKGRLCSVSGVLPNGVSLAKSNVYGISGVPTSTTLTTLGSSHTTTYGYNRADGVAQTTYPNGTVVRQSYSDWGLPTAVHTKLPGGTETTYATVNYHHTGQPGTVTITNGLSITHNYDSAKLYRKTSTVATMGGNTLQSYSYSYDNVNNITQIVEPGLTKTYTYDDLNRLTQAVHAPSSGGSDFFYSYNAIGNITSFNGATYNYSGAGKANPHAVTSIGAGSYTYDDNGNIVSAPGKSYLFNWQNQMTSVYDGTNIVTFAYDENGERFLYQTPNTTEVQVDDAYIVRGGVPEVSITLGGIPLGTISNGTIYSAITDHLNTPVKQVDSAGAVVEGVRYDPYGKVLSQTGSVNTKHGYTGHEEDSETGLVYAEARYYNPSIGRFMSQDPVFLALGNGNRVKFKTQQELQEILSDPQLLNSYSYALNNPLGYVDVSGEWPSWGQVKAGFQTGWSIVKPFVQNKVNQVRNSLQAYDAYMDTPEANQKSLNAVMNGMFYLGPIGGTDRYFGFGTGGINSVGSRVSLTASGALHIQRTHTLSGEARSLSKSYFFDDVDYKGLITKYGNQAQGAIQGNGNVQRILDTGRPIGWDATTNGATSFMTIITDKAGTVITSHPGLPSTIKAVVKTLKK